MQVLTPNLRSAKFIEIDSFEAIKFISLPWSYSTYSSNDCVCANGRIQNSLVLQKKANSFWFFLLTYKFCCIHSFLFSTDLSGQYFVLSWKAFFQIHWNLIISFQPLGRTHYAWFSVRCFCINGRVAVGIHVWGKFYRGRSSILLKNLGRKILLTGGSQGVQKFSNHIGS